MTPLALLLLLAVPKAPPANLHLIGRFATAQACPVAANLALTCAHVVDLRPFDLEIPLYPTLWTDDRGGEGLARPVVASGTCDLALLSGAFPHWYELAAAAPALGSRVRFAGYDWRNRGRAYDTREVEARVVRIVAGHVITDRAGELGSSGSCVLDEQDRVVAIHCSGHVMESGEEVGRAVGIWTQCAQDLLAHEVER